MFDFTALANQIESPMLQQERNGVLEVVDGNLRGRSCNDFQDSN